MAEFDKGNSEEYISLADAGREFGLSQNYLRLLILNKKLHAVKFGRNWVTTRTWMRENRQSLAGSPIISETSPLNTPSQTFLDTIQDEKSDTGSQEGFFQKNQNERVQKVQGKFIKSALSYKYVALAIFYSITTLFAVTDIVGATLQSQSISFEKIAESLVKISFDQGRTPGNFLSFVSEQEEAAANILSAQEIFGSITSDTPLLAKISKINSLSSSEVKRLKQLRMSNLNPESYPIFFDSAPVLFKETNRIFDQKAGRTYNSDLLRYSFLPVKLSRSSQQNIRHKFSSQTPAKVREEVQRLSPVIAINFSKKFLEVKTFINETAHTQEPFVVLVNPTAGREVFKGEKSLKSIHKVFFAARNMAKLALEHPPRVSPVDAFLFGLSDIRGQILNMPYSESSLLFSTASHAFTRLVDTTRDLTKDLSLVGETVLSTSPRGGVVNNTADIRNDLRTIFTNARLPDPTNLNNSLREFFESLTSDFSEFAKSLFGITQLITTKEDTQTKTSKQEAEGPATSLTTNDLQQQASGPLAPAPLISNPQPQLSKVEVREVIERKEVVATADVSLFENKLDGINSYVLTQFSKVFGDLTTLSSRIDTKTPFTVFAQSQKVDQLVGPTIKSGLVISDGKLDSRGDFNFDGSGTIAGTLTVSGSFSSSIASTTSFDAANLITVRGTGTSTFAGGISISSGCYLTPAGTCLSASGGGTPGGSNGQVQYNNNGSFGGDTLLIFEDDREQLAIGTSSPFINAVLTAEATSTASIPIVVRGFLGQAEDLLRVVTPVSGVGTTTVLALSSSGSLGIGTATPGALIAVNGSILAQTGTSTFGGIISSSVFSTTSLGFYTSSNDAARIFIDTSGNVGVGTTGPGSVLSINGPFLVQGTSTINGAGLIADGVFSTTSLNFYTGSNVAPRLNITSGGNIGIGVKNPVTFMANTGTAVGDGANNVASTGFTWSVGVSGYIFGLENTSAGANRSGFFVKTNTYNNSASIIHAMSGGSANYSRFIVLGNGNVGVGTTTPQWIFNPTSSTTPQLALSVGAGVGQWAFRNAGGNLYFATTTVEGTATTSSVSAFTILGSSGFVGIASDSPGSLFAINGPMLAQGTSTFGGLISPSLFSTTSLGFYTSSNDAARIFIDTSGNVGVGTTGPGALLSLNGSILAQTGTSTFGGIISSSVFSTTSLGFYTSSNDAARIFIDTSGNVGVGTTGPGALLSLNGSILAQTGTSTFGGIITSGIMATNTIGFYLPGNTGSTAPRMTIDLAGQVGIGPIGSTTATLDVSGTANVRGLTAAANIFTVKTVSGVSTLAVGLNTGGVSLGITDRISGANPIISFLNSNSATLGSFTDSSRFTIGTSTNFAHAGLTVWALGTGTRELVSFVNSASSTLFSVLENGNTGIGTTSPYGLFSVEAVSTVDSRTPIFIVGGEGTTSPPFIITSSDYSKYGLMASTTELTSANVPGGSMIIGMGALCVDNGGSNCDDAARARGVVYSTAADVTNIDVAENYPTLDQNLEAGDLVMLDSQVGEKCIETGEVDDAGTIGCLRTELQDMPFVSRARIYDNSDAVQQKFPPLLGVISTEPGVLLGGFGYKEHINHKQVPVALVGRVPVKVSTEGGAIKPGDKITVSSVPGVGMKATTSGETIGVALTPFNGQFSEVGKILVFVNLGYAKLDDDASVIANTDLRTNAWSVDQTSGKVSVNFFGDLRLNGNSLVDVSSITGMWGGWSIDESGKIVAKEIQTEKLCVGKHCVTEVELGRLLQQAGILNAVDTQNTNNIQGIDIQTTPTELATTTGSTATTTEAVVELSSVEIVATSSGLAEPN